MVPLDGQRRVEAHVGFAFLVAAAVRPDLAAFLRERYRQLHEAVAGQICRAQYGGAVPADLDAGREADVQVGLVDGVGAETLIGLHTAAKAMAAVDYCLERLFVSMDGPFIG